MGLGGLGGRERRQGWGGRRRGRRRPAAARLQQRWWHHLPLRRCLCFRLLLQTLLQLPGQRAAQRSLLPGELGEQLARVAGGRVPRRQQQRGALVGGWSGRYLLLLLLLLLLQRRRLRPPSTPQQQQGLQLGRCVLLPPHRSAVADASAHAGSWAVVVGAAWLQRKRRSSDSTSL